ncbi:MAG: Tn3 family transposase, partial [Aliarcobacter sp.]|nr:Tn3 family transposase [Aliarcobacter sp.]
MSLIKIITSIQKKEFEEPPILNQELKNEIFKLPNELEQQVYSFNNSNNQIHFILMFGYFKIAHKFFDSATYYEEDIEYVISKFKLDDNSYSSNIGYFCIKVLNGAKSFKQSLKFLGFYILINSPKYYQELGYQVLPKRKINIEIIEENWDNILRFILTIKSRRTTASQLLKRLTSYSKHHKLFTAIKEFGKIIKTDFLLTYIDDVGLRQRIEKQLNKVESANRFSKAVFFGNNAEFIFATQEEQNIANNCKRLIQNAIILWNYLYIDKKLQEAKSQSQKDEIIEAIKNSSIVHWSHINFYGTYDFTKID